MKTEGLTGQDAVRPPAPDRPGWRQRARFRRRLRYLRSVRELAMRDLGGLIFDMYRFGSRRQDLVREKLDVMFATDNEVYTLETALGDEQRLHELRIPGVRGNCPECGTLNSTDARFCSNCAEPLRAGLRPAPEPAPAPPAPAEEPYYADPHGEDVVVSSAADVADHEAVFDETELDEAELDDEEYDEEYEDQDVDEDELPAEDYADEELEPDQPTVSFNGPAAVSPNGPVAPPNGPVHAPDEDEAPQPMSAGDPLGSDEPPPNGSHLATGDPLGAPRDEPHR